MKKRMPAACAALLLIAVARAEDFDAATAFGSREEVSNLRLSPDGKSVAYLRPMQGQGSALVTLDLSPGSKPQVATYLNGDPERLESCNWVSNSRFVCTIYGLVRSAEFGLLPFTRLVAVDRNGGNVQLLSNKTNSFTRGLMLGGGSIIDWLPDEEGHVLMQRTYIPDDHLGSRTGSTAEGLGVDWLDTTTSKSKTAEYPGRDIVDYIADGHGTVRIVGRGSTVMGDQNSGITSFYYRKATGGEWKPLSRYNEPAREGFLPVAVDKDLNVAYGLEKKDGRIAAFSVSLDDEAKKTLLYQHPQVDVEGFITIGRRHRVVGLHYAVEKREAFIFDPTVERLRASLAHALPGRSISIVDSSRDENVLLVFAGSDDDAGLYYVYNRSTKELATFLVTRNRLEGVKLAKSTPMSFPASDGTSIPGYLTLPPGVSSAKGLPAIVLPHGGPAARDEWGFDWLPQFYALKGYVVLQPEFRGSAGFGDAWLQQNGFKSWRVSIGDVLDAGHYLVKEGIADPARLAVVGWSYGGYAALQSAVVEPGFFKAVVAIAPVTDLDHVKEEWRDWSNFNLVKQEIGDGPHIKEGSPARNADKIKVPVLLFHGGLDRNVSIQQSKVMDSRLTAAGVKHELVTWDKLDHQLEDSAARIEMLKKSDAFLRESMGTTVAAAGGMP